MSPFYQTKNPASLSPGEKIMPDPRRRYFQRFFRFAGLELRTHLLGRPKTECWFRGGLHEKGLQFLFRTDADIRIRDAGERSAGRQKEPVRRYKKFSRRSKECGHGKRETP